jgi:hypothetical protein
MTTLALSGIAYAEANWGRWIARCPARGCYSARQLNPGEGFICDDCGHIADVVWPPDTALIEHLLILRPDVTTRNWLPGETTDDLWLENIRHGVPLVAHPELGASASRLVLDTSGGVVRMRLLDEPLVIDSAPLPIGA